MRSGVLTGNDTRWRSASSGSPLPKQTDFGPHSLQLVREMYSVGNARTWNTSLYAAQHYNKNMNVGYYGPGTGKIIIMLGGRVTAYAAENAPGWRHESWPIHDLLKVRRLSENKMPCYHKDDRAMRPIAYMGALKIFESPCIATPI